MLLCLHKVVVSLVGIELHHGCDGSERAVIFFSVVVVFHESHEEVLHFRIFLKPLFQQQLHGCGVLKFGCRLIAYLNNLSLYVVI